VKGMVRSTDGLLVACSQATGLQIRRARVAPDEREFLPSSIHFLRPGNDHHESKDVATIGHLFGIFMIVHNFPVLVYFVISGRMKGAFRLIGNFFVFGGSCESLRVPTEQSLLLLETRLIRILMLKHFNRNVSTLVVSSPRMQVPTLFTPNPCSK
jgi:hypothetical protein